MKAARYATEAIRLERRRPTLPMTQLARHVAVYSGEAHKVQNKKATVALAGHNADPTKMFVRRGRFFRTSSDRTAQANETTIASRKGKTIGSSTCGYASQPPAIMKAQLTPQKARA
jgi:hypothetical protein